MSFAPIEVSAKLSFPISPHGVFLPRFRWYKTPDDKPLNGFGFDEECLSAATAKEVIEETHQAWKGLQDGSIDAGKLWLK